MSPPPAEFFKLPADLAARPDLPATAKIILAVLAWHVGRNGVCWPGIRTLSRETGLNKDTVMAAIRRLEAAGDLFVQRHDNGKSSQYSLPEPSEESGRLEKPTVRKTRTPPSEESGRKRPKTSDIIDRAIEKSASAAAPPSLKDREKTAGHLVALWYDQFKGRVGRAYSSNGNGKLAGIVTGLATDFSEEELVHAVKAQFSRNRDSYAVELFKVRLVGGEKELLLRRAPVDHDPRGEKHTAVMREHLKATYPELVADEPGQGAVAV